jgi:predicted metal-dependent phosphoesterase TrpH
LIDLHTHTTASDGRSTPAELVARAKSAGVQVLSVTDHDTTAACAPVAAACARAGIEFVPGIEITAIVDGKDVHMLGYFMDPDDDRLGVFLAEARRMRINRIRRMVQKLAEHGIHLDVEAVLSPGMTDTQKAAGRPWIARALIAAGHVATIGEAFDRWLSSGRPAFVERIGPTPEDVIREVHGARGLVAIAHPGLLQRDDLIPGLARAGMDAIEAYHSKHPADDTVRYLTFAERLGLSVSGGSDYHADPGASIQVGSVTLPRELFDALKARAFSRRSAPPLPGPPLPR